MFANFSQRWIHLYSKFESVEWFEFRAILRIGPKFDLLFGAIVGDNTMHLMFPILEMFCNGD